MEIRINIRLNSVVFWIIECLDDFKFEFWVMMLELLDCVIFFFEIFFNFNSIFLFLMGLFIFFVFIDFVIIIDVRGVIN